MAYALFLERYEEVKHLARPVGPIRAPKKGKVAR